MSITNHAAWRTVPHTLGLWEWGCQLNNSSSSSSSIDILRYYINTQALQYGNSSHSEWLSVHGPCHTAQWHGPGGHQAPINTPSYHLSKTLQTYMLNVTNNEYSRPILYLYTQKPHTVYILLMVLIMLYIWILLVMSYFTKNVIITTTFVTAWNWSCFCFQYSTLVAHFNK